MALENGDRQQDDPAPNQVGLTPEQQLAALEVAVYGMAIVNDDGCIIYANPACANLWQYDNREHLIGQSWQRLYAPEEQQRFEREILPQCLQAGSWTGEAIAQRQDGTTYPQALALSQMTDGSMVYIAQDITERHLAEDSLRRSEADKQAILQAIPDLLMHFRGDGTHLDIANSDGYSVLELDKLVQGNASVYDLMPYELAEQRMHYIQRALQTGQIQFYEQDIEVNGQIQSEEVRLVATGPDEVLVIIRNITERKRSEAALRQSEAKNRALIEAIPDLLIRMRGDGTHLELANGDRYPVLNKDKMVPGKSTVYELMPPDLAEMRMRYIRQALQTGKYQFYEQQIEINGQLELEEVRVVVTGPDEVLLIIRNITERKRQEEALRIAEENYRSIFENALEGIFQSTPEGRLITINPAMARIYGYDSPADMIASITDIGEQMYVEPSLRLQVKAVLATQGFLKGFEFRSYCKDGSIIWTAMDARAVYDSGGTLLYYEGIVQDVTERKRKEEELKRQLEQLEIQIDQSRRAQEVAEIVQTDYFQKILEEAESLRYLDD
ncbi:PAS domain S-box protein [Thermoleptolyngbya oregonensis NK1-22]|uniref:PAS domain S-box protein n=1 Tax=Thermoleptolyngbya oregonensis NK1-22 TaxID=2547457 RepID=A0AA96Y5Z7_9CYAN|nr:PAS domain S-box protein [Thermoleptolyngbya oregonensis]WOB44685.1 PAS domain S-box protein [Thermoleptolyngbya oregonensis NK1-22]